MAASPKNPVLRVIRQMGLVRPVDVETRGISRAQFYRLVRKGLVARQARGIYVASQHPYTTEHTLAQVAKRVPAGAFCLLTALRFHGLTTQSPAEVWIALTEKARKPRRDRSGPLRGRWPGDARHAALPGRDRLSGRKSGLPASVELIAHHHGHVDPGAFRCRGLRTNRDRRGCGRR